MCIRLILILAAFSLPFLSSCSQGPTTSMKAGETVAKEQKAQALFGQAKKLEAAGKTKKAIKLYQSIADVYPLDLIAPKARFQQASLHDKQKNYLEAFDIYEQFIKKYPGTNLYAKALNRQAAVAHAAAQGEIKNSFLGLKSRISANKVTEMMEQVRANAPQAPTASQALFTIAEVRQNRKQLDKAIPAYQRVVNEYPRSKIAPEAQFRVGKLLMDLADKGNQNKANLNKSRSAYEDLIQLYPRSKQAGMARKELKNLGSQHITRSYEIAQFYEKKGDTKAAAYYYKEVIDNTKPGAFRKKAKESLANLRKNEGASN